MVARYGWRKFVLRPRHAESASAAPAESKKMPEIVEQGVILQSADDRQVRCPGLFLVANIIQLLALDLVN